MLGNITVKEGETVNVGSLLGTVNNSKISTENDIKEINKYSPPRKEKEEVGLKVFQEEKTTKQKEILEKILID